MNATPTIDLNCDLGEGAANDEALMPLITSANIACGAHAGDATTMRAAMRLARRHGVAVGAHPGFADREHFGRRELPATPAEIVALVREQLAALSAIARTEGVTINHVKPHGALYNMAACDATVADAIAEAVASVDSRWWLYGLANGALLSAGRARGLRVAAEVFADRTYQPDGTLTPRSRAEALIHSTEDAVAQVLRMVREGRVRANDGTEVPIVADTLCVHGDGANAVAFARAMKDALGREGVRMRALSVT